MKRNIFLVIAVLTALCLLPCFAACGREPELSTEPPETAESAENGTAETEPSATEEGSEAESETETETETAQADETATLPPVADEAELRCGVWWAIGDGIDSYYEICADGTGAVVSQENGAGVGMNYEIRGNRAVFHMGAADVSNEATLTKTSENELTAVFADGHTEFWSYQGNVTLNGFTFYSNERLCAMAKAYLEATEGLTVSSVAANEDMENPRTINIQLYDNLGDHNSTAAWYFVDRFTAKGADLAGNEIDLAAQE